MTEKQYVSNKENQAHISQISELEQVEKRGIIHGIFNKLKARMSTSFHVNPPVNEEKTRRKPVI